MGIMHGLVESPAVPSLCLAHFRAWQVYRTADIMAARIEEVVSRAVHAAFACPTLIQVSLPWLVSDSRCNHDCQRARAWPYCQHGTSLPVPWTTHSRSSG